jgi:hypothetical protein
MNTQLSTVPSRHSEEHHPPHQLHPGAVRRVGLLDRAALHLGLALITWGRRPSLVQSRERRVNRVEASVARLAREREAERLLRTTVPQR